MKTITLEKIKSMDPCSEGYVWYQENFPQKTNKVIDILNSLVSENKLNWANWLIVRCLTRKQKIQYAIFAAEQVIETYEKKHPDDERPRKAIEAAKEYSKTPSVENKFAAASASAAASDAAYDAAYAAASAAYAAAHAAYAAYAAAYAAYDAYAASASAAAYAAAHAAYAAAHAASSAASDAYAAAYAAYDAVDVDEIKVRIIRFGMAMLEEEIQ